MPILFLVVEKPVLLSLSPIPQPAEYRRSGAEVRRLRSASLASHSPYARPQWGRMVLGFGVLAVASSAFMSWMHPAAFEVWSAEDGPIEWLTVIGLAAVGFILLKRWLRFRKTQNWFWGSCMLLAASAMFFAVGEEISWGQRITNWGYGGSWAQLNRQGETNIHNLNVGGYNLNKVLFTYGLGLVLGIYFLLLPWLARRYKAVRNLLLRGGIPLAPKEVWIALLAGLLLVLSIPDNGKWEVLELMIPVCALAVLWWRGPVGEGLATPLGIIDVRRVQESKGVRLQKREAFVSRE